MLPKYSVEFSTQFRKHAQTNHYGTDDPVACEEFISELLEHGHRVRDIRHEGLSLPRPEFDHIVKTAAGMLATRHICTTLGIDHAEAHHRFGLPA